MANQDMNDLLWLADIHLIQGAEMRHQHILTQRQDNQGLIKQFPGQERTFNTNKRAMRNPIRG